MRMAKKPPQVRYVKGDTSCFGCGYSLAGHQGVFHCPECGIGYDDDAAVYPCIRAYASSKLQPLFMVFMLSVFMPLLLLVYAFIKIKTDLRLFGMPIGDFLYNSLAALGGVVTLAFALYCLTHKRPYAAIARDGLVVSRSGRRGSYIVIPWSELMAKVRGNRFNNPLFDYIRDTAWVYFEIHIGEALALHIRRRVQNLIDAQDPEFLASEDVVAVDPGANGLQREPIEGAKA